MNRRRRSGFSLIELVVAAFVTLLVLTASGLAVANTETALANGRARDTAGSLATAILEKSTAFGCGLAVNPGSTQAASASRRCTDMYTRYFSATSQAFPQATFASALDARFPAEDSGGRSFDVTVTSRWRQVDGSQACRSTQVPRSQQLRPGLLERTVSMTWTVSGTPQEASFSSVQAAPAAASYQSAGLGGVIAFVPAGSKVTLSAFGDGVPLTRFASTCTGGSADAAAWFPYLPAGVYLLSVGDGAASQVSVMAGQTTEVTP